MSETLERVLPEPTAEPEVDSRIAGSCCRACGRPARVSDQCCLHCGSSTAGPASGSSDPRGLPIELKTGLFGRSVGIVSSIDKATLHVVTADGEDREVSVAKASALTPNATAAAVRVWNAVAQQRHEETARRLADLLDRELLPDVSQSRALARHAVAVGDPVLLERAQLSQSERTWLLGHLAWRFGQRSDAAEHFSALPVGCYPDVDGLLACLWREVAAVPERRSRSIERARANAASPWCAALLLVLNSDGQSPPVQEVIRVCERLARLRATATVDGSRSVGEPLAQVAEALRSPDSEATHSLGGAFALRAALLARRRPTDSVVGVADVDLPLAVADDLIDAGVRLPLDSIADERAADRAYLLARTDPSAVPDEELEPLGMERERLRRALLDGDCGALIGLTTDDSELAALARLASGDTQVVGELALLYSERGDEHRRRVVTALGRSLTSRVIEPEAAQDRSCWPLLGQLIPEPSQWTNCDASLQAIAAWSVLHEALRQVWAGNWEHAASAARNALRVTPTERSRDEALNVLAYASWMLDLDDVAVAALRDAVDGERNANLQVNYSLVAGSSIDEEDKYAASVELAALAQESTDVDRSVQALQRALALWNEIPAGTEIGDVPPPELVAAARGVAVLPTTEAAHDSVMAFLSWADSEWLGSPENTSGSRWADTTRHRYRIARAQGPTNAVVILRDAGTTIGDSGERAWARGEAASMAEMLVAWMLADLDAPPIGFAMWGLELCDAEVLDSISLAVRLELLAAATAAKAVVLNDDGYPADMLWEHMEKAIARYAASPEAKAELPEGFVDGCVDYYARSCRPAWARVHDLIVDPFNSMLNQLASMRRSQVNRAAVRRATDPLLSMISSLDHDIHAVRKHVRDVDVASNLDELRSSLAKMHKSIMGFPR